MPASDDSEFLLYSDMGCAVRPPGSIGACLAEASMTSGGWMVLAAGAELHLHLVPGACVPPDAGPGGDLLWDLARSLVGSADRVTRATLGVAAGPPLTTAGAVTDLGGGASGIAGALAHAPAPLTEAGPDAAWDRLAPAARRAQAMRADGRLIAAALAYRGRGRLIGPLRGDRLIRFGVSTWR